MDRHIFVVLALFLNYFPADSVADFTDQHVLKRHKRYVAFPEGSTFIVTLCISLNVLDRTENIFLQGVNWGISYDLPNATTVIEVFKKNKYAHKRMQKRDLYNRMETLTDKMGFGGKDCIYRALCETPRKLHKERTSLAQDILRQFFEYPLERLSYLEPDEHRKYHWASRYSTENSHLNCWDLFPDCTISIIDIALGNYSGP
ncbi:uncharacterized protein LOC109546139 [Dendroctonus ponderosae]|uniref:Uncharacterized protein n=1 Tax=Dendroctonus ponderosae TaxID=77166 RepID=A0AAR5QH37_DENPD|nr:uncharacterized protein LOC109546139 [Dendroctonus ponderosae]KAH1005739.1 hypothetical protein HUJ04_006667 [Dendroctonus ponderosae]